MFGGRTTPRRSNPPSVGDMGARQAQKCWKPIKWFSRNARWQRPGAVL